MTDTVASGAAGAWASCVIQVSWRLCQGGTGGG